MQDQRSLVRWGVGVLGTLAACLLLPAPARASCGDYVTANHRESFPAHAGSVRPPATSPQRMPVPNHKPCSGPLCSRAPLSLPTAPPQLVRGPVDEATFQFLSLLVPESTPSTRRHAEAPGRPIHRATDIF